MIHRRAALAIIVLLALAFVTFSAQDSLAGSSAEKRFIPVRWENSASSRLDDGSVLPITGDPDEPSTWKRNTTGGGTQPFGGILWRERSGVPFRFDDRFMFVRFLWMYLRSGVVGAF